MWGHHYTCGRGNFILDMLATLLRKVSAKSDTHYDFPSVSAWLNKLTASRKSLCLLFERGETWLVLDNGLQLKYTNKLNSVSAIMLSHGRYEALEIELVCANLSDDSVFFDIGANVGLYSLSVAYRIRRVGIHAFEPVPDTVLGFRDNLSRNGLDGRVILNQLAVGETDGQVYITSDHHSSNYLIHSDSDEKKIEVGCTSLDKYVRDNSIQRVDVMKVDVEGREFSVLKGAVDSLERFRPIVIVELMETPSDFFDRKVEPFRETINLMVSLDYEYYVIDDKNDLVHMRRMQEAFFSKSYHNYLFYHGKVNVDVSQDDLLARPAQHI